MVIVTQSAKEQLTQVLKEKQSDAAVRVYVAGFGWGGPSLGLALDELKDEDKVFDQETFKVVVNSDELSNIGNVEIDFRDNQWGSGFSVRSTFGSTC